MSIASASSDHPLWRTDLKSVGYPEKNDDLQRRRNFANFDTIAFISDDLIAVTFITRESIPNLQRRDDPNHLRPYRLHAIILEVASGKTVRKLEWPLEEPTAGLFPRNGGGFLVLTGEHIVAYSEDGTQSKELLLSDIEADNSRIGGISLSPSHRSLVIQFLRSPSPVCVRVRTVDLSSSNVPCGVQSIFTASDDRIVEPEKLPNGDEFRERDSGGAYLEFDASENAGRVADRGIHKLTKSGALRTACTWCAGIPQFINDDNLVVYSAARVSIVDRAGGVTFTEVQKAVQKWIDEFGRPVRPSASGQRFAVVSNITQDYFVRDSGFSLSLHMSTGDLPAEFPYDIRIFDLSESKWIFTLRIDAAHLSKVWGLALSPSGDKLAVDSGGAIQAFALPSSTVAPSGKH